jgi:enoyl-CoA hydratase/carnithine racemase
MGDEVAHRVLWEGVRLNAYEAVAQGLVHEVLRPEQLMAVASAYCERVAALPVGHPERERRIEREGLTATLRAVNEAEVAILEKKWVSSACFTALATYLDSRKMYAASAVLRYVYI